MRVNPNKIPVTVAVTLGVLENVTGKVTCVTAEVEAAPVMPQA